MRLRVADKRLLLGLRERLRILELLAEVFALGLDITISDKIRKDCLCVIVVDQSELVLEILGGIYHRVVLQVGFSRIRSQRSQFLVEICVFVVLVVVQIVVLVGSVVRVVVSIAVSQVRFREIVCIVASQYGLICVQEALD